MSRRNGKKNKKLDEAWYLGFGESYREVDRITGGEVEPSKPAELGLEASEPYPTGDQEGWIAYDDLLKDGGGSVKPKPRMSETTISKGIKLYAIASSIFGISLLLSGRVLEAGIVFGIIVFIYLLSKRGVR